MDEVPKDHIVSQFFIRFCLVSVFVLLKLKLNRHIIDDGLSHLIMIDISIVELNAFRSHYVKQVGDIGAIIVLK